MRNEDVVEAMKQMELSFKQHTDAQFAAYTKILEQYMSTTDHRFGQLHQQVHKLSKGKSSSATGSASHSDQDRVGEGGVEAQLVTPTDSSAPDLVAILMVLKVDVPRFNG